MATYIYQVSSGSATATTDLGFSILGVQNDGASVAINASNLHYGLFAVDASGRIFVTGNLGITGGVGITGGTVTAVLTGTGYVLQSGNTPWGVSGSALTASAICYQNGTTWGVSASAATAQVSGQGAHNAAITGYPVRIGMQATAFTTAAGTGAATASSSNSINWLGTTMGVPFMVGGAPNIQQVWMEVTGANVNTNVKLVDIAAGTKIVVTEAGMTVAAQTTVNVSCRIALASASGATTIDAIATSTAGNLTATQPVIYHPNCPPGAGVVRGNGVGVIAVGGDGCDMFITHSAPTNGRLGLWVTYFTVPA